MLDAAAALDGQQRIDRERTSAGPRRTEPSHATRWRGWLVVPTHSMGLRAHKT